MGSDSIDPKAGEEIRKMDWKFVISLGLMLIFIVIAYYRLKYPTSVQVVDAASSTFAIEGATTVNAKIAGEIHRFDSILPYSPFDNTALWPTACKIGRASCRERV